MPGQENPYADAGGKAPTSGEKIDVKDKDDDDHSVDKSSAGGSKKMKHKKSPKRDSPKGKMKHKKSPGN